MLQDNRKQTLNRLQHNDSESLDFTIFAYVAISIAIASALSIFPLQQFLSDLRPFFIFIIILFWVSQHPAMFGIWFAFSVGILSDLLLDTRLGQQGISAAIAIFFFQYASQNNQHIRGSTSWVLASSTIIIFNTILLIFQHLDGQIVLLRNALAMLTSVLLWMLVSFIAKKL